MAKGNPFLGSVSGSFGDITLSTYRGKTVIRRKTTPRNPRTPKQIYQRMFFATISKSRTALKPIIDHSFEQVQHGVDSLNYFTKRNIALMREGTVYDYAKQTWVNPNMNFVAPKATSFPANPLRISEGSLNSTKMVSPFLFDIPDGIQFPDYVNPDTCVPFITDDFDTSLGAEAAIEAAISRYEINVGDFLTIFFLTAKKPDITSGSTFPVFPHFIRYKLVLQKYEQGGEEKLRKVFLASNVDGVNWNIPNEIFGIPNGYFGVIVSTDGERVTYPYVSLSDSANLEGSFEIPVNGKIEEYDSTFPDVVDKDDLVLAATWIHSRPGEDGKILTSTQDLTLADPSGERIPFNLDMETAFDLWTKQAKAIGEPKYLLEGGDV